jgi:hypothetical protein
VSPRRSDRPDREGPLEQFTLGALAAKKQASTRLDPEEAAKAAIARRAKPSAVPGYVKITITLELKRALAERLSARAIRETKNLEGVIAELLQEGMR